MRITTQLIFLACLLPLLTPSLQAQDDPALLSIDRIFASSDFRGESFRGVRWMDDGESYSLLEQGPEGTQLVRVGVRSGEKKILVGAKQLTPKGADKPLQVANYQWSHNKEKLLIFTNTRRVWRANTRGDYWVLNLKNNQLKQMGADLPEASLMFTKFDADDKRVAYVSGHNVYVEEISSGNRIALTDNGSEDLINGTFDWAYEEEFGCRDGFRWSPNGSMLAYWQIDASEIRDFMMINNTDSTYSFLIPVEYPKVGETPSSCRIGIVDANGGETHWLQIPGDPRQNYLPRMLWSEDSKHVLVQQVNRKQNTFKIWWCDVETGKAENIYTDQDEAWIDVVNDVRWLDEGEAFSWVSEKGGWKQLYQVGLDGTETLLTPGAYDMIAINAWNGNDLYLTASLKDPTQRYLYHINLKNKKKAPKRISPQDQSGTHSYQIAPGGKYAVHSYSNANTPSTTELVSLPDHKVIHTLAANEKLKATVADLKPTPVEFFQITTEDGVTMEGYQMFPADFDKNKRYPVLFYVYSEPAGQTARDAWGGRNGLWHRMLAQQGYLVISLDNRGTPSPKGREWRKSIYQNIGIINIRDQGMAVKEILKWSYVDADRIAAWGWSGGGSCTLNLLFQWPELYKTGMSVAPVSNQLYYDNIYQERYMGLPQEEMEPFVEGSPITHAKNLQGNLLLIHGTGDDNVHYQNSEALINELIKENKQFQVMPYPNRSHGIYEGTNTSRHLYTLMTNYLMEHTPPGGVEQ